MLVGVAGKAASGKDTVAAILKEKYGFKRLAFADELKRVARHLLGLTDEDVTDHEAKERVNPRWGKSPRQLLQGMGEGIRRYVHEDVWVNFVLQDVELYPNIVISDLRYPNEAKAIKAQGGFLIRVNRPGKGSKTGADHVSETALDSFKGAFWDHEIDNSGTLDQLATKVREVMADLEGRPSK